MIVFLGFVIVVLVMVVMGLLMQIKCMHEETRQIEIKLNRELDYVRVRYDRDRAKLSKYHESLDELAKLSLNVAKMGVEMEDTKKNLSIAIEDRDACREELKQAKGKITALEKELLHRERLIESQTELAELAQKEIHDLYRQLRELPDGESAKALTLQYLQEIQNLTLLNELLVDANSKFAAQFAEMEQKLKEMEIGNIVLPEVVLVDEYAMVLAKEESANDEQEVG